MFRIKSLVMLPALVLPLTHTIAATTYERAEVVGVSPVYNTVSQRVPIRECQEEEVAYREHRGRRSATGPILGAIVGGALGHAVGNDSKNKKVGAAVGAVLGGSIGADVSRRNRSHGESIEYRTQEVCRTSYEVREEERLAGYDVSYLYAGTTYKTRMNRDPGDSIRVRVRVSPAE